MYTDLTSVLDEIKRADLPGFDGVPLHPNAQSTPFGETPLHVVAIWGHADAIRILLDAGADIDARGEFDFTPLHEAIGQGHWDAVRLLISRGASLTIKNEWGDDAAALASRGENEEIVKLIQLKLAESGKV
ncbi:MAG: hypothetical protein B9S32_15785 [Verrucomicrobia bacterium Tous-C9LFEB]|nr:MAG: hypothetical protein B9S32_15785 [Verrucomicrobia bacterium Tous-C9LFEB]